MSKRYYRVLFVDDSPRSHEAVEMFQKHSIAFGLAKIEPDDKEFPPHKLPTLISSEGQWTGPEAVQRYIDNNITQTKRKHPKNSKGAD